MSERRFEFRFDPDALHEYQGLDKSVVGDVDKALERLETRADEIGKPLQNKHSTKLHWCKEIKLRKAGPRIVFRVTTETVDVLRIAYVLTIERRDLDFVFDVADTRWGRFKRQSNIRAYLDASPRGGKSSTGKLRKKNRSRRK